MVIFTTNIPLNAPCQFPLPVPYLDLFLAKIYIEILKICVAVWWSELILRNAGRTVEDTVLSVARPASRVPLVTRLAGKGPVRSRRSRVYDEPGVPPVHAVVVYHKEADSLPKCRYGTTSGHLAAHSLGMRGRKPIGAFAIGARATSRSTIPPP